ncbi:hypothetical protein ACJX0J_034063, partial [Zea mays]
GFVFSFFSFVFSISCSIFGPVLRGFLIKLLEAILTGVSWKAAMNSDHQIEQRT